MRYMTGSAATAASARKTTKYSTLSATHMAVETLGVGPLSDEAHSLMAEIGRRATLCTADPWETTFLYQRIYVAIQRFNAVCLANTFTVSESPS